MHSNQELYLFDTVLRYIWTCREQAVNRIFPQAKEQTKAEWMGMTAYRFWNTLDEHNQRRLIQFAREHYGPPAPEYEGGT